MTTDLVVDELTTPFDDLDSPATVATPSCCCCCCCCIVTVAATSMLAASTVRRDLERAAEKGRPDERRARLVALAGALPVASLVIGAVAAAVLAPIGSGDGVAVGAFLVTLLLGFVAFGALRIAAGRPVEHAIVTACAALVVATFAAIVELALVLVTAGLVWLGTPLYLLWIHRRSQARAGS